jgi:hypothetical protein
MGSVGRAVAIPGGGPAGDGDTADDTGDDAGAESDRLSAQEAIRAPAAAAPMPSNPSRRKASRRVSNPSTWSVAISSATYLSSGVT